MLFPGYVAEADLPAVYNLATVFVYPSLYEGFGIPPLEAMACGVPVVCSNSSSLPEVAGDAALMIEPADSSSIAAALAIVLADDSLRQDLRRRGLAQAQIFTWEEAARRLLAAYQSCVSA